MNKVIPGKEVGNQDHLLALDVFFSKDVKGRKSSERNLNSGQSEILKKVLLEILIKAVMIN